MYPDLQSAYDSGPRTKVTGIVLRFELEVQVGCRSLQGRGQTDRGREGKIDIDRQSQR